MRFLVIRLRNIRTLLFLLRIHTRFIPSKVLLLLHDVDDVRVQL
jgi:hypothetical protein